MSRKIVALAVLALTGAFLVVTEPVFAAGRGGFGGRIGMTGGGFRGPLIIPRAPARAGVLKGAPRPVVHGLGRPWRSIPQARRAIIPPSPHGFATTTPRHPFARLTRRHHGIYHQGWYFPATIGDDYGFSYIGTPYDPSEAIPVYGPAPSEQADDPAPRAGSPVASRVYGPAEENRDACRAEKVTVPSGQGEREITVVRC